jgi:Fe2+ or Zn2+ uptake regulation protein
MNAVASKIDSDIAHMADAIKQYLGKHPQAADTLEGIVHWWLLRQRYESTVALVNDALELLVQQGFLSKIDIHGSQTIYHVRKDREDK